MLIKIAFGDYGNPIPIYPLPQDGRGFSPSELAMANYNLTVYRVDRLKIAMELADAEIIPVANNGRSIHYYRGGQSLKLGDELLTITSVDMVNQKLLVTRGVIPTYHPRADIIRHIISQSPTAVSWDPVYRRLILTPEASMVDFDGVYNMEIEIDTGTRRAICLCDNSKEPYKLIAYDDVSG